MTFAEINRQILSSDPFYGCVMMGLDRAFSLKIDTACVCIRDGKYELHINEDFWNSLDDLQQVEIIKHELMHLCLFHLELHNNYQYPKIYNIACDAEVNQYLDINNLPGEPVLILQMFPGIEPKAGADFYYKYLLNQCDSNSGGSGAGASGSGDSSDEYSGSALGIEDVTNHDSWSSLEGLEPAEIDLANNILNSLMLEAADTVEKMQGTIPAEVKEHIERLRIQRPPVYNWKREFRRLLGTSENVRTQSSRKHPSKRFKDSPGVRKIHECVILVGVDTSGSVSTAELQDFFHEIDYIAKAGAEIYVAECDARIHSIYRYSGKLPINVQGRGGTSFTPVIEHFNNTRKYSVLVYFTDGYCDIPVKPNRKNIWVITSNGKRQDYPGKTIFIPKENG